MRNRLNHFQALAGLFAFKTILDEKGNEYVVYLDSAVENLTGIEDKTVFEALENHVHLLDNIKPKEFEPLISIGSDLGKALLASLKFKYPDKRFFVYVTINSDSFIIRFHQRWEGESPYINPDDFMNHKTEKIIRFQA